MFSKEWFTYVFGRWLLLSGIAGATVQVLFADVFGIPTFFAFLANQFCLACVFWYVDKFIFKHHLADGLENFFRFPRIKTEPNIPAQLEKLDEEYTQFKKKATAQTDPGEWLNEFVDLVHTVEMTERVLREKGIDVDIEYERVKKINEEKDLY